MGESERQFTLAEAERELAKRACDQTEHDFEIVINGLGEPISMICSRCCRSWGVADGQAQEPAG